MVEKINTGSFYDVVIIGSTGYVGGIVSLELSERGISTIGVGRNPDRLNTLQQIGIFTTNEINNALNLMKENGVVVWLLAGPKHNEFTLLKKNFKSSI